MNAPGQAAEALDAIRHIFRSQKATADGALAQLAAGDLLAIPHEGGNSIAVIIRHLRGNMLSRWTDFLTTDGEKPWRQRDTEFEQPPPETSRDELLRWWEEGWGVFLATLDSLAPEDLSRTITIRGQEHTVLEALLRQTHHYGYHTGQLVLLARWRRGPAWETLSIARGASADYKPSGRHGEARPR
ncbi:MAG: DinB family protein [Candidatus Sumerlaeia bacterium]|nr:DinB family protein [Candidatus Sumerlaeia bacterium]